VRGTSVLVSAVLLVSLSCQACMQMEERRQFFVHDLTGAHVVKPYDVSPFLRSLSPRQLQKYTDAGNRIRTIRMNNGDYRIQEEGGLNGGGGLLAALAVAGTLVVGGVATVGAAAGGLVVAGPAGAFAAGLVTAKATCAAAVYVGIVTTVAPTP